MKASHSRVTFLQFLVAMTTALQVYGLMSLMVAGLLAAFGVEGMVFQEYALSELGAQQLIGLVVSNAVHVFLLFYGARELYRMLESFRHKDYFTDENVGRLRTLGGVLIGFGIVPNYEPGAGSALQMRFDLTLVMAGIFMTVLASVLSEGVRMREEQELTI